MNKPTCETCEYFAPGKGIEEMADGECHERLHPSPYGKSYTGLFLETYKDNWCSKHPDFPAYLASLKQDGQTNL